MLTSSVLYQYAFLVILTLVVHAQAGRNRTTFQKRDSLPKCLRNMYEKYNADHLRDDCAQALTSMAEMPDMFEVISRNGQLSIPATGFLAQYQLPLNWTVQGCHFSLKESMGYWMPSPSAKVTREQVQSSASQLYKKCALEKSGTPSEFSSITLDKDTDLTLVMDWFPEEYAPPSSPLTIYRPPRPPLRSLEPVAAGKFDCNETVNFADRIPDSISQTLAADCREAIKYMYESVPSAITYWNMYGDGTEREHISHRAFPLLWQHRHCRIRVSSNLQVRRRLLSGYTDMPHIRVATKAIVNLCQGPDSRRVAPVGFALLDHDEVAVDVSYQSESLEVHPRSFRLDPRLDRPVPSLPPDATRPIIKCDPRIPFYSPLLRAECITALRNILDNGVQSRISAENLRSAESSVSSQVGSCEISVFDDNLDFRRAYDAANGVMLSCLNSPRLYIGGKSTRGIKVSIHKFGDEDNYKVWAMVEYETFRFQTLEDYESARKEYPVAVLEYDDGPEGKRPLSFYEISNLARGQGRDGKGRASSLVNSNGTTRF